MTTYCLILRRYGAPKFQALFVGISGVTALGVGIWGNFFEIKFHLTHTSLHT
jgi:hypothetical protein